MSKSLNATKNRTTGNRSKSNFIAPLYRDLSRERRGPGYTSPSVPPGVRSLRRPKGEEYGRTPYRAEIPVRETDPESGEPRLAQAREDRAEISHALDPLELLVDIQDELFRTARAGELQRPAARDARRHRPEVDAPAIHVGGLVRLPVLHVEGVRDDAGSRPHREDLRPQPHVERRQKVHGEHGRLGEIGDENVALDDLRLAENPGCLRIALGMRDHVGVVFDAESAGSEFFCGGDRDLAVAGSEIDHIVFRLRLRHVQHALDDLVRSRHPYHVLALLADVGLEVLLLGVRRARRGEQRGGERRQDAPWNCTKHIVLFLFEWELCAGKSEPDNSSRAKFIPYLTALRRRGRRAASARRAAGSRAPSATSLSCGPRHRSGRSCPR